MIRESVIQENTTIQNIHVPNSGAHNVQKCTNGIKGTV